MLLVGFFESFAAGWIFGIEEQIAACGRPAVVSYFCANFMSVIFACAVWFGTKNHDVSDSAKNGFDESASGILCRNVVY